MDLSGFKKLTLVSGESFISITDRATAFNQNAVIKIGSPQKVCLLLNQDTKQLAVIPADVNDTSAINFLKPGRDPARGVRFNSKDFQYNLAKMMEWDIDSRIYRINGEYDEENNAMIFSLSKATSTPKRAKK